MPGYIRGFVERKTGGEWEFVSTVDSFTGSQGDFKYAMFGTGRFSYLEPVTHEDGFPDDLTVMTKLNMIKFYRTDSLNRVEGGDKLEQRYQDQIFGKESSVSGRRTMKLSEMLEFDWNKGVSDEKMEELRENPENIERNLLDPFVLRDPEAREVSEWRHDISDEKLQKLFRRKTVDYSGREVHLERKSRRQLVPEAWFDLLDLLGKMRTEDVRFVFYWHH